MNNTYRLKVVLVVMTLFLHGCAYYTFVKPENAEWKKESVSLTLPLGWSIEKENSEVELMLTKDGNLLQTISVVKYDTGEKLPLSKKKFKKSMLIEELAGVMVDELSLDKILLNFTVLENVPVKVDGLRGFKIVFTHENIDFVKYKSVLTGFLYQEEVITILYSATEQFYFERDLNDYDGMVQSMRIAEPK